MDSTDYEPSRAEWWLLRQIHAHEGPVSTETVLWEEEQAESNHMEQLFGPRPHRSSVVVALGKLYDHYILANVGLGWTLLPGGEALIQRADLRLEEVLRDHHKKMTEQRRCNDCGVHAGEAHQHNCDVARCVRCGCQAFFHAGWPVYTPGHQTGHCTATEEEAFDGSIWTGEWPAVVEAQELGLYSKFNPDRGGWIATAADDPDPGTGEDLNAVTEMAVGGKIWWSPVHQRFFLPNDPRAEWNEAVAIAGSEEEVEFYRDPENLKPQGPPQRRAAVDSAVDDVPAYWIDATNLVMSDEKRWDEVEVGDIIQIKGDHGPVVEADVDPLFCAHIFEDGARISESRDRVVAFKRPATEAEKAEWIEGRRRQWALKEANRTDG